MITFTPFSSFTPQSDATARPVDSAADSSTNFFSLLLALFSPGAASGVTAPQDGPVESADVSANTPEFAKNAFPLSEPFAEEELTEKTTDPSNASLAQPFLLAAVTPFLWENKQTVAETLSTTQPTIQNAPFLLSPSPSLLTSRNGERHGLNLGQEGNEETFQDTVLQATPLPDKGGMISMAPLNIDGQESKRVATPLVHPEKIALSDLEPLAEGKHLNVSAVELEEGNPEITAGEQNLGSAKGVEIQNSSSFAHGHAGKAQLIAAPKDLKLPEAEKTASLHPDVASEEQPTASSPLVVHDELLIPEPSSHGKVRGTVHHNSQPLTDGSLVAPTMLGNGPTAALPSQAEGGASRGVETWREVVNQVRDGIVTNIDQSNHEAHIQLDPPELGKLAIQLVMEGEHVHAHIVAESADVGALIQAHLPELKQALQSHRLDLDTVRVDVQTGGENSNPSSQHSPQEERTSRRGRNPFMPQGDARDSETALSTPPIGHRGRVSVWA